MSKRASTNRPSETSKRTGDKVKSPRTARDARASQVFYVYCAGLRGELEPLFAESLPAAIEPESALELIGAGELAAVLSAVPLASYGEEVLAERLSDAAWTATRAMRHEQVVEHFARRAGIVPLRFGTIYLSRERVEEMLAERSAELLGIVARLAGKEEWGVNVFCERAKLREQIAEVSPRLREMGEQAAQASPGQSYLLRKKIEAMRDDETRATVKRTVNEIERALSGCAAGATRLRVLPAEAAEHGELVSKLVFLVARAGFDEFRLMAERLAAQHAAHGFQMELTGPWPAYNFAAGEEKE